MIRWNKVGKGAAHWRTLLAGAAIGNIAIGAYFTSNGIKTAMADKEWGYWLGAGCLVVYVFMNVFSAVNGFFFDKLAVHFFLMAIHGFDVLFLGFVFSLMEGDYFKDPSGYTLPQRILFHLLLPVLALNLGSVFVLFWKFVRTKETRASP